MIRLITVSVFALSSTLANAATVAELNKKLAEYQKSKDYQMLLGVANARDKETASQPQYLRLECGLASRFQDLSNVTAKREVRQLAATGMKCVAVVSDRLKKEFDAFSFRLVNGPDFNFDLGREQTEKCSQVMKEEVISEGSLRLETKEVYAFDVLKSARENMLDAQKNWIAGGGKGDLYGMLKDAIFSDVIKNGMIIQMNKSEVSCQ